MPVVPIVTPSETDTVLNSIGVPPAARIPCLTCRASARWFRLQGIVSIQVVATPTSGLARSSSVKPTALSIARAGRPVDAVGERRAVPLGGIGGLRVDAHRRLRSVPGDGEGEHAGVVESRCERGGHRLDASGLGPHDDRRAGAGERHAGRAVDRAGAQLGEQRRVGEPERLVQVVVEGVGEERRVARGDRGAEQGRLRGGGGRLRVAHELGQPRARLLRVHAHVRDDDDRRQRQVAGEPAGVGARVAPPDQADAAAERGREIVGMALERQPELEQLVEGGGASGCGDARRRARRRRWRRTSRGRARAGSG